MTGGRRRASFARRADGGSPALGRTGFGRTSPVASEWGRDPGRTRVESSSRPSVRSNTIRFALTSNDRMVTPPSSASRSSRSIATSVPGSSTTSHSSGPSQRTSRPFHVVAVFDPGASNGRTVGIGTKSRLCARSTATRFSAVTTGSLGVVEDGRHDLRGDRAARQRRVSDLAVPRPSPLDHRERDRPAERPGSRTTM